MEDSKKSQKNIIFKFYDNGDMFSGTEELFSIHEAFRRGRHFVGQVVETDHQYNREIEKLSKLVKENNSIDDFHFESTYKSNGHDYRYRYGFSISKNKVS